MLPASTLGHNNYMSDKSLFLLRNEDRRLCAGHLWIYSNEVDTKRSPLKSFQAGELVRVKSHSGKALGTAYINPHSLICARIISHKSNIVLSTEFFESRIRQALALRERLYQKPYYRLIFGESDLLPGIIVDRFNDILVIQINTAAMDIHQALLLTALDNILSPTTIVLKNTSSARKQEGLENSVDVVKGDAPDNLHIIENGIEFKSPLLDGQKTGWYYDHGLNRSRLSQYVPNKSFLDVFSYVGAWGIQAALAGASTVQCVDSSQKALDYVAINAQLNQLADKVSTTQGDAFEALKKFKSEKRVWDCINLDPPAFVKRKKDLKQGLTAYRQINSLAMELLPNDGILISSSCSFHLSHEALRNILLQSARKLGRYIQILEQGHQGPDHPIHPAIVETAYLKTYICRISDAEVVY
jgi:23S rRNA (cytosine1962-C5)-methyltransferase